MAWLEEVETRIETLRAKQRGEGHDLTQRQAHELGGEWYRWFTGPHEENPGKRDHWDGLYNELIEWIGDVASDPETMELDFEARRGPVSTRLHRSRKGLLRPRLRGRAALPTPPAQAPAFTDHTAAITRASTGALAPFAKRFLESPPGLKAEKGPKKSEGGGGRRPTFGRGRKALPPARLTTDFERASLEALSVPKLSKFHTELYRLFRQIPKLAMGKGSSG
jgi:hypothetical protein